MRLIDADALLPKVVYYVNKNSPLLRVDKLLERIEKAPTIDAVPVGAHEQVCWERDVAIAQLKDYGVSFGEKADCVKVVRCAECNNGTVCANMKGTKYVDCVLDDYSVRKPTDFCSYGERRSDEA